MCTEEDFRSPPFHIAQQTKALMICDMSEVLWEIRYLKFTLNKKILG